MRIKVHVEGIKSTSAAKEGEEPSALLHGVLEVDGHLIEEVGEIEALFRGGELVSVRPRLFPGSFEVVSHTDESWPRLLQRIDGQNEARAGTGKLIAVKNETE